MRKQLPPAPDLEELKQEAQTLLRDFQEGDPEAAERLRPIVSLSPAARPMLVDAQHVIAREYGFASWPKLKARVESAAFETGDPVELFKAAVNSGDATGLRRILKRFPELMSTLDEPWFSFDSPAIVQAAGRGNRRVVDTLLRAGASVNARSRWWAGSFGVLDCA